MQCTRQNLFAQIVADEMQVLDRFIVDGKVTEEHDQFDKNVSQFWRRCNQNVFAEARGGIQQGVLGKPATNYSRVADVLTECVVPVDCEYCCGTLIGTWNQGWLFYKGFAKRFVT